MECRVLHMYTVIIKARIRRFQSLRNAKVVIPRCQCPATWTIMGNSRLQVFIYMSFLKLKHRRHHRSLASSYTCGRDSHAKSNIGSYNCWLGLNPLIDSPHFVAVDRTVTRRFNGGLCASCRMFRSLAKLWATSHRSQEP